MPKFTGLLVVALFTAVLLGLYYVTREHAALLMLAIVWCVGFGFFGSRLWKGSE